MCGIAGKFNFDPLNGVSADTVRRMTNILRHRGPDDEGVWIGGPVGLGSRRLAVIDLSPRGHQPMSSGDGSLTIAFNGEIYNFQQLRRELEAGGCRFRSDTDTEVILHLYARDGVGCLDHLRGMFAFALWDARSGTLFIARDRLGKKPLFYRQDGTSLQFGSEPKSIFQDPDVPVDVNPEAIHHYLTYGYVPGPWSAFQGVHKLQPAHYLLATTAGITTHRYWSLHYRPKRTDSEDRLGEELLALFEESVRIRLISDVPLGALLSGGIDSSAVVALMRRLNSGRLQTFSIGFDQPEYDELAHARHVAQHLGTDHHEAVVKPDVVGMLTRLVWHYNEPFADASALPSFSVCEMARRHVTVALNGDGGDESFLGYDRYVAAMVAGYQDRIPLVLRRLVAGGARHLPLGSPKSLPYRLRRFAETVMDDPRRRYGRWMTFFGPAQKRELYTPGFAESVARSDSRSILDAAYDASDAPSFLEASVHTDVQMYLPDDLLVKMDIASMAHSLELRSPFLDHKVVEFAASLPAGMKLRRLTKKYILKRIMKPFLPAPILHRKKMGFGVPIDHWLRNELRDLVYDVLLDSRARERGILEAASVRRYVDEHMRQMAHHHFRLWSLLMLEMWYRTFVDAPSRQAVSVCQ